MDPATLAIGSLVSSVAGGITSLIGGRQAAAAEADSARYQAAVYRNNQLAAEEKARYAAQAGQIRAQAQSFKNRAEQGKLEAAQSASGIDLASPSLTATREGVADLGLLDTATIENEARIRSQAYEQEASNLGASAGLADARARSARRAGAISGVSSILGTASSFADKWNRFKFEGAL